jgi:hypothetical protein
MSADLLDNSRCFLKNCPRLIAERMGYKEFKLEIPTVPNLPLKLVFIFHFIFISWATLHPWATQVTPPPPTTHLTPTAAVAKEY